MKGNLLFGDVSVDAAEGHLDGAGTRLQLRHLLLQILPAAVLHTPELVLLGVVGLAQLFELVALAVFVHLAAVEDHEAELVLGGEVADEFELLGGGFYFAEAFLEHGGD